MSHRKPSTPIAMRELLDRIAKTFPLHAPSSSVCSKRCVGCPKKMLEFLDAEASSWQAQLAAGREPTLGELHKLGKTAARLHRVFKLNGLIA
ncbi:hypothetical protein [Teredinibacter turnerae]|uniref:hypothetical protein n=1 Tax=Teredinibacter turnerae TaxID=2426 RepID=UPI000424A48D|nr:hypothetical protein [Teredinibacter turnerae]